MSYPGCVSISHLGGGYNNDSIEIPRYDYSTTYSATGMLHCGLAKQAMREAATICPAPASWPLTFWPWKWCSIESRVTWVNCASFALPRPLCSRLRPDVRDRQTSDAHRRLMPPTHRRGGIINRSAWLLLASYITVTLMTVDNIGGGAGDGGGSCPHLQTRGQTVSNAPHFADLVEWCLQVGKT